MSSRNGAVVVTNPGEQFPFPSRTLPPNDIKATLYDRNTAVGEFSYTVIRDEGRHRRDPAGRPDDQQRGLNS